MTAQAPDELVRKVREEYAAGASARDLRQKYGLAKRTLVNWVSGRGRLSAGGPIAEPGRKRPTFYLPEFEDLYDVDANGCWVWNRSLGRGGYGRLGREGKQLWAHRWSWALANGPIPEDMTIDHLCFNPPCINPSHLRLLEPSENFRNTRRFLANECKRGHKFTPENTGVCKGRRRCMTCTRARQRARIKRLAEMRAKAEEGAA